MTNGQGTKTATTPGTPGSPWTRQRITRMLAEEDMAYQRVALPYGLATAGDDRSGTCQRILPDDMTGKSVLDVGCQIGYFCFEAIKRGATHVVGVDVDDDTIRKAKMLADCLALDPAPQFKVLDIETQSIDETFDYVLCLNVLHHFKNPLSALEKLGAAVREKLILELVGFGRHDRKKMGGVSWWTGRLLQRQPILYAGKTGVGGRYCSPKFIITPLAVQHLLTWHRNQFVKVQTASSQFKDRYVAIANKRRIKHLVVMAGPTGCGKSHLIDRLQNGELDEIAGELKLQSPQDWPHIEARRLRRIEEPILDKLILHYNFLSPFHRSARSYQRDEALDLLDAADHLTIITLWTPPPILIKRFEQAKSRGLVGGMPGSRRLGHIHQQYHDGKKVVSFYRRWFDYALQRAADHYIISTADDPQVMSMAQWESEVVKWPSEENRWLSQLDHSVT